MNPVNVAAMARPTFMYHEKLSPEGTIFDAALEDMKALEDAGWVNTPAKFGQAEPVKFGKPRKER